ncbi:response regulator transcription factor [Bacillus niameyensis]|uniref:response regulator transcription factor n=1 Tax=Bacillus niameyensis TaxID=1522308 RepID=UPI00078455BA|nr:response regulator transcription factor [Bacillus niameyensis]
MSKTILVIEDDQMLQNLMAIYLKKAGFHVVTASTGKQAIDNFHKFSPCFIILDLMIPEITGEEVCGYIRNTCKSDVPIIMVTAKINEQERIKGLKMGADDYVTKPFSPEELVTRINTVLRRASHHCQKIQRGNLTLKPKKHEIWQGTNRLHLTPSEFAILKEFMYHPNQVLTRDQLLQTLYPLHEKDIFERTIDVHVKNIREKIRNEIDSPIMIQTIRGVGYKFVIENEPT